MSTSASIKRKPREENNWDENTPEESSDDSSQEILGDGDTEIFRTLIPMMKDVNVLKICRLVCKSWNQFACESLRKLPWMKLIREDDPGKVDECLAVIIDNKNLALPSPFRNFKVHAQNFREKSLLRFLKYVRDNDNNYSIELSICSNDGYADSAELQNVMITNLNILKITKLLLCGKNIGSGPEADDFQPEKIRLPYLKMLHIENSILTNDKILVLCETICHYSPLRELKIEIDDSQAVEKLKKIMSTGGMKSVERMSLNFELDVYIYPEDWEYICARIMEITCIKKFKIDMGENCGGRYCIATETVIEHFADSLESINADYMPTFKNKCFPKLRQIKVEHFTKYYDLYYPVERYPLLRKLKFSTCVYVCDNPVPSVGELSLGIEELHLKDLQGFSMPDHLLKLICVAGMALPSVYSFRFSIDKYFNEIRITSAVLNAISKSFPKLTALDLDGVLTEDRILSGLRDFADELLEKDWPMEQIPRDPCLLDFQGLEKLSLGPDVNITSRVFTHCLSKMPKLQYMTFYWNGDFSAVDVRESVGHLLRITVILPNKPEKQWVEEMNCLRVMLPTVVELKEVVED